MPLNRRVARAQLIACVVAFVLVLPVVLVCTADRGGLWSVRWPVLWSVLWSVAWGMACYVVPATGAGWLTWREASPGMARMIGASLVKLLGAGALLAVVLGLSTGASPAIVVVVFVICAVGQPLIAAAVAARPVPQDRPSGKDEGRWRKGECAKGGNER